MAFTSVQVRLEVLVRKKTMQEFIRGYEDALTLTIPIANVSTGAATTPAAGAENAVNILGLERVGSATAPTGYLLHRLSSVKRFAHEIDPVNIRLELSHIKLTWLDSTETDVPFTVVYPIGPPDHVVYPFPRQDHELVDTIPNRLSDSAWELLIKRTGDSPANYRYFLRQFMQGSAGDGALPKCEQLKAELDALIATDPDNLLAIMEAEDKYLMRSCPALVSNN